MAQFSQRTVTNNSDHMIAGIPAGSSVTGGFKGAKDMLVSLYKSKDGTSFAMRGQLFSGENNRNINGDYVNVVPNIGPSRAWDTDWKYDAAARTNEVMQTQVLDATGLSKRWDNGVRISDTQYAAYLKAMEAACGGPVYVMEVTKDGVTYDLASFAVSADIQRLHGDHILEDGSRERSVGAMPKLEGLKRSTVALPMELDEFNDLQRRAWVYLREQIADGNLTCTVPEPKRTTRRTDVIMRVWLNEKGEIPRSEPNRQHIMFVPCTMLAMNEDGSYTHMSPPATNVANGRRTRETYADSEVVRRMVSNGIHGTFDIKRKDGTVSRCHVIAASVEIMSPQFRARQSVVSDGEIRAPEHISEITLAVWDDAIRSARAKVRDSGSRSGRGSKKSDAYIADGISFSAPGGKPGASRRIEPEDISQEEFDRGADIAEAQEDAILAESGALG